MDIFLPLLADFQLPDLGIDMQEAVKAVIVMVSTIVLAAVGAQLALWGIKASLRKAGLQLTLRSIDAHREDGMDWEYEEKRIRQGMEVGAYKRDSQQVEFWGRLYESHWGGDARRKVEEDLRRQYDFEN